MNTTPINRYPSMIAAVQDLQSRGYNCDFQMSGNILKCLTTNKLYQAQDITIVEYHRFEGITNPEDMSIIFVVECTDNTKGTVVSAYGTYADIKLLDFMDKVKIKEAGQVAQDEQGQHRLPQ
jgi:hypothetical protein